MWRRHLFYLLEFGALQGNLQICHAVYRTLRSSTVPRRGTQRRSCSGPSMLRPNTRRLYQLKQLVELHRAAELAMKGFIVRMWPGELMPSSYFGMIKRMVDACPRLEVIKRSVCIEGARRAFARVKVHLGQDGYGEAGQGRAIGGQGTSPSRDVL